MRGLVSILVLVAIGPVVFSAPFLHLHGHGDSDHFLEAHSRQALAAHAHLSTFGQTHGPGAAISSCEDEDAVSFDWFQNHPQPAPHLELVLVEATVIPVPEPVAFRTEVPLERSHDPPLMVSLSPRSPPAA